MLLISKFKDLRNICISYVRLINHCFHLFRYLASSFSSQHLLFLKSSRSCVLLLPTPFTSIICPSVASWRRQFLFRIWSIQLTFLHRILFRSVCNYTVIKSKSLRTEEIWMKMQKIPDILEERPTAEKNLKWQWLISHQVTYFGCWQKSENIFESMDN